MPLSYLAAELRAADPDRYLLSLFAPADRRDDLWALYLFNYEISKTRDVVSDTTLGLIRLQWWRDEIGKIYTGGDGGKNPVLSTLAKAVKAYDLSQDDFNTLIYAHEFDLEDVAPANLEGLHHYADFTTTPLTSLTMKICGESADQDEIRRISVEYAVLRLIRSVPYMLSHRRCLLPQDALISLNLTPQKLFDFNHKSEIIQILQLIQPLTDSYRKPKNVTLRKLLKFSQIYLKQLRKYEFDVFRAECQAEPPFLALRLLMA